MSERERRDREIMRALRESAELEPPSELDAIVRAKLGERASDPLLDALGRSAALEPPPLVDRAVRGRIASWRPARRRVPMLLPLVAAAASVVTLFAGLSGSLDSSGQAAYAGAALAVSVYLGLSAVAALPLLMVARRRLVCAGREARP